MSELPDTLMPSPLILSAAECYAASAKALANLPPPSDDGVIYTESYQPGHVLALPTQAGYQIVRSIDDKPADKSRPDEPKSRTWSQFFRISL